MATYHRRDFIRSLAAAGAGAAALPGSDARPQDAGGAKMRLGLIVYAEKDPETAIRKVSEFGFPTCQVGVGAMGSGLAEKLRRALDRYKVEATSLVVSGPGPEDYDFYKGPLTIGLVPKAFRAQRIARMKHGSDLASQVGIPAVQSHCGFIPENPNDPVYAEVVAAVREVAAYARKNGQSFRCETGQETPVTLLRAIKDVGLDNVGVNFDAGNLILYGKADPVEALDVLGPFVQGIHAKDGLYPTDPRNLGKEVPIGQGKVNFPRFIARLKEIGYHGAVTIEREIEGPQQAEDIRTAKAYLEKLIG